MEKKIPIIGGIFLLAVLLTAGFIVYYQTDGEFVGKFYTAEATTFGANSIGEADSVSVESWIRTDLTEQPNTYPVVEPIGEEEILAAELEVRVDMPEQPKYAEGQIVVKFNQEIFIEMNQGSNIGMVKEPAILISTGNTELDTYLNSLFLTSVENVYRDGIGGSYEFVELNSYWIQYGADIDPLEIVKEVEKEEFVGTVLFAEPNYYGQFTALPDDEYLREQLHLVYINTFSAWSNSRGDGGRSITIAILDSGVDMNHPDLIGKIRNAWDMSEDDGLPTDNHGHGTKCSGLAAAETNNMIGVAGVCPKCNIMPLKITKTSWAKNDDGAQVEIDLPSSVYAAQGIARAIETGADIISCSWRVSDSELLIESLNIAQEHNVIVVAASGNTGKEEDIYPASFDNVISVSAVFPNNVLTSFATYNDNVDIAAPGLGFGKITTEINQEYSSFTGTSMSAPIVAGAIGYILSEMQAGQGRQISLETIRALLTSTSGKITKKRNLLFDENGELTGLEELDFTTTFGSLDLQAIMSKDTDNDRLADVHEYRYFTDPNNPDCDNDGILDGDEITIGSDPFNSDSDGDGLEDGEENIVGTDPTNPDSDNDGVGDKEDVKYIPTGDSFWCCPEWQWKEDCEEPARVGENGVDFNNFPCSNEDCDAACKDLGGNSWRGAFSADKCECHRQVS